MDYQTSQVTGANGRHKPEPISGLIGDIGHHVATLADLQMKLAAEDVRTATSRLIGPMIAAAVALCLGLAGCVVLMFGIANLLVVFLHFIPSIAYLIVAALGLILAALLVIGAIEKAKSALAVFERSRAELLNNLRTLTSMLQRQTTPVER
jgi:hypothetical protein